MFHLFVFRYGEIQDYLHWKLYPDLCCKHLKCSNPIIYPKNKVTDAKLDFCYNNTMELSIQKCWVIKKAAKTGYDGELLKYYPEISFYFSSQ